MTNGKMIFDEILKWLNLGQMTQNVTHKEARSTGVDVVQLFLWTLKFSNDVSLNI